MQLVGFLQANNQEPNLSARMRKLIWTFAVLICTMTLVCVNFYILSCITGNGNTFDESYADMGIFTIHNIVFSSFS